MGTSDQTDVVRIWRPVTFGWHPRWGTLPWAWAFNLWGLHRHVQLCLTLHDPVDCSPPGSSVHEVSRREFWSGVPFPPPGDLPDPGTELESQSLLHWQVGSLPLSQLWSPGSALSPDSYPSTELSDTQPVSQNRLVCGKDSKHLVSEVLLVG